MQFKSRFFWLGWIFFGLCFTHSVAQQREPDSEVLKIDTNLVTIPVIVSDRNDVYLPNLTKEEFQIFEDGKLQELVFFTPIKEPFNVVLMIDSSGSFLEKFVQIQNAARVFVDQLQPADRIKLISFDDEVREWGNFTNNRAELKKIIGEMQLGKGTKLYDAMRLALNDLSRVKGRKAIVLFTDGVDYRSFDTKYEDNIRMLEEAGVIVYPIRYDTRGETEALVRRQQSSGGSVVLSEIIKTPQIGSTPPTVPGDTKVPSIRKGGIWDPSNIPPMPDRRDRYPDNRSPDPRYPDSTGPDRIPSGRFPDAGTSRPPVSSRGNDSIGMMLDNLYKTADQYLNELAVKSGGKLHRADTLESLPEAFAKIAGELRNQYSLGYYPINQIRTGKYRRIQVKVNRKEAVVRARPGYREPRN